jgi:putative oxidoreductase
MNPSFQASGTNLEQGTRTRWSRIARFLRPNVDSPLSNSGALVVRLATGLFIAGFHGWHKLAQGLAYVQHGSHWPLLDDVEGIGLPFPVIGAFAATITQLLGGVAVAAGFLTRLAAFAVAASLVVAAYSNFLSNKENQLALLYCLLFTGFALYGGGRYSVDECIWG